MSNSSLQVYGGDEISAVVIDPGSFTTNIGYSGTDCPQAILPSYYGEISLKEVASEGNEEIEENSASNNKSKKIFGEQSINYPRADYEIKPIVKNGEVIDWDGAQEQWDWALKNALYLESNSGIPAFLTEPIWNTVENRKKSLEVLLEGLQFEACYLSPTPTCISFASGRPNCLVVDIGHDVASVSPVIDGMTLSKSSMRNFISGRFINEKIKEFLKPREIIPLFEVKQRKPEFIKKTFDFPIHQSVYDYANDHGIFQECKETLCQIAPTAALDKMAPELESLAKRSYETLWKEDIVFDNVTRYSFAEHLFVPKEESMPEGWPVSKDGIVETWHNDYVPLKRNKPAVSSKTDKENTEEPTPVPSKEGEESTPSDKTNDSGKRPMESENPTESSVIPGIVDLIESSIMATDVDLRASLAHNIVLTGGTSCIPGFSDRLMLELNKKLPALKFRVLTTGQTRERQYQAWLGGSILSSLGTFHQLWVGKQEYEESGADRLLKDRFR
ncbi:hypothetical protein Kpol_282p4 [Vanderwaltozyma polyspora DSM 70294]|uniref:Actin-related protein 4 n=1 Tax=Vanderwaltozyma polyspora (strain ATCC 22028 / DSM 70294 / BCRC 21397 / CBS 2163 / NBRC 10782 / NRRL Y-8283 / UCD 57-17) TaxID=436907 RepID=A7TST0_VANPO|nr:uncharacterized protein Kpol_282p4 [Vanderwaltozyma polyspora DSM 70294]EDO14677.1 hypothetical protein Kpol_282p4 [Vanderwaltozyma polyspora DSM 70294]